jgi:hypothetical protein
MCTPAQGILAPAQSAAQQVKSAKDISGTWSANLSTPMGEMEIVYKLKVTGDKITGTASMPFGDAPIIEGAVEGENVHFTVQMDFFGNTTKSEAKGKIVGDTLVLTPAMPPPPGSDSNSGDFKLEPLTFHRKAS